MFQNKAQNLTDEAKVRLLLRKIDTNAHSKYFNVILLKKTSDFTFDETVTQLMKLFSRHQSLFNIRFKCLQTQKTDNMDLLLHRGSVNKACEDFQSAKLSSDQFKCLIFIMGMKSRSDLDVRTKLLSKLSTDHEKMSLDDLCDVYERLLN